MLGLASVATISFLSGCTVLSMSCYTVGKNIAAGDNRVDFRTGTPLAIGAAVGGVVGKQLFSTIAGMFPNPNTVGVVQSICLAIITIGTFVYTLFKARIQGKHITNPAFCVIIGLVLGLMSSFWALAAAPSIWLCCSTFQHGNQDRSAEQSVHHSVQPDHQPADHPYHPQRAGVHPARPGLMIAGGIGGGIAGRTLNKRMSSRAVDKLFLVLMGIIILISIYNAVHYMGV